MSQVTVCQKESAIYSQDTPYNKINPTASYEKQSLCISLHRCAPTHMNVGVGVAWCCIETVCTHALNKCFYTVFIAAGEGKEGFLFVESTK